MNTNRYKIVLTPERIGRVLGLPADAELASISVSQDPPGVHVVWSGASLPDGWALPNGAGDCPEWTPSDPVVRLTGSILLKYPPAAC